MASIPTVPLAVGVTVTTPPAAGSEIVALGVKDAVNDAEAVAVGVAEAIGVPETGATTSSPSTQT
ncbi:hypothetical protein GCM10022226_76540 [Sphaerisporangium flaviroseum]|uniref:Uncharacterized protein n=1 Tax=Sphaerisporangium flaviroseum TaxID=509199 RepID=A0ABP7JEP6_9ACTN